MTSTSSGSSYGRADSDRRALAVDVAALANTAGGVIVIGIEEDDQARATAAAGVDVSDAEASRIRQIVAALVAPLPMFDIVSVTDSGDLARGFLLVAVPRSANAPHAVLVNDGLRYPRRNGATIRYLSEPEVAAAYRERSAGVAAQAQRVLDVEREAVARLDHAQHAWLLVSLTPDLPGDLVITTAAFREFQETTMGTQPAIVPVGVSYQRTSVGRRRLLADGTGNDSPLARYTSLELHGDGAGAFGLQLRDMTPPDPFNGGRQEDLDTVVTPRHRPYVVNDEAITIAAVSGLVSLARHARDRAAAGGNAILRATLLPATNALVEIGHNRDHGLVRTRSRVPMPDSVTAESVVPLDALADAGPTLAGAAASLVDEIGQAFGIPELGQLGRDGRLRSRYWSHFWSGQVITWAEQHSIEVTSETLTG